MIRGYFSIAFKYLLRQPAYSLLSITGFALAFAAVFFLYSRVSYQLSFDKHLENSERVYRLSGEINLPANENIHGLLGPRLGPVLKEEIPAVHQMTRLIPFQEDCIVAAGEQSYFTTQVYYADSTVFEVFPLSFLYGATEKRLINDGEAVISESLALKYFGRTDVLGEVLRLNNEKDYHISGVTEDLPENVHHKLHLLLSMSSLKQIIRENMELRESENFWRPFAYTFILLGERNRIEEVEAAFPDFYEKYMAEFGRFLKADFHMLFIKLTDLHFTPPFAYDLPKGNRSYIYLLMAAGVFLLLIALLNYTYLFSASLSARTRSLGLLKIHGAERRQIYNLLFSEALIILILSAALAWFLLSWVKLEISTLLGGALAGSAFRTGSFLLLCILLLLAFILAVLPPVISRVYRQPMQLLGGEGMEMVVRRKYGLGKGSIVVQFALSAILIMASILISRQVNFMLKSDPGYRTDQVLQIPIHAETLPMEKILAFKEEVLRSPLVNRAAYSSNIPGEPLGTAHFKIHADGEEASKIVHLLNIDSDYIPLMGMEFLEGANFRASNSESQLGGVILNEACIEFLGLGDSLTGRKITGIEILGVVKNGKYNSLHAETRPIVFSHQIGQRGYLNVELSSADIPAALQHIQVKYQEIFMGIPFEFSFLDETMEAMYRNDIVQSKILGILTILGILVAHIGLFGLLALLNRKRIREIGIRKVNGAQRRQVAWLISRQVLIWAGLGVLLAIPLTWHISRLWLQNFADHIHLSWWMIIGGGGLIEMTAFATTLILSLGAAARNPVNTLRYE